MPPARPAGRLDRLPGLEAVRAEKARRSLAEFVRQAWPIIEPTTDLVWGWHVQAICEHLEALTRRQIANLVIEVPPGSGKSTICAVLWPAWSWIDTPSARFLTGSYGLGLAVRDAVRCRRIIESPWYQAHWGERFQMTSDQNVKSRYENSKTGYRVSLSVGSATTGERGSFTLIDDAHNVIEAESDTKREAVIRWHDEAFFNRINDYKMGGRVVIGQRTAQMDLIGHLIKMGGFEELRIPEEFEATRRCTTRIGWSDPRTEDGTLMRPVLFGPEQVKEARKRLGSIAYAAQYQQNPVPREGAMFKSAWFRATRYTYTGDYYMLGTRPLHPHECRRFATVDHACSTRTSADYTVVAIWDDDQRGNLILAHLERDRVEGPDLPKMLKDLHTRWRPQFFGIECIGAQLSVIQAVRRSGLTIRELRTAKDKQSHALAAQVKAEAGQIWLPAQASWLADFEDELFHFPAAPHDDQVDVLSYAAEEMVHLYAQSSTTRPMSVQGMGSLKQPMPPGFGI
jgi:predicted phage terminase large subunit-like protein